MLAEAKSRSIVDPAKIEKVESHLLDLPQVECPVVHHFGPGIYIREVTLPRSEEHTSELQSPS